MNGKPNTIFLGFLVPYVDYWKYSIVQLFGVFFSESVCFVFFTRAAMTSIQQLRGDLTSSGDQPSTNLATYFKVGL